jgi:DNA-directed RNA polymerase specialized sigma24 family protein
MDQILAYPMRESAVVTQALPLELRLDVFLGSIERRALRIAEMATRDRDEALDLMQEAMLRFVRKVPGSTRRRMGAFVPSRARQRHPRLVSSPARARQLAGALVLAFH